VRPNVVCSIGLGVPDMATGVLPRFDAMVISPGTKPEDEQIMTKHNRQRKRMGMRFFVMWYLCGVPIPD